MSAFVVDKRHVDAIVASGLSIYRGRISGHDLNWHASDPDDLDWPAMSHEDYFAGLQELHRELTFATADAVGQMLLDENVRSVLHRYPDTMDGGTVPGPCDEHWRDAYRFTRPRRTPTPVETLKLISCLEYQSCEHPEWKASEARRFCEALRLACIDALPGYADAAWTWEA